MVKEAITYIDRAPNLCSRPNSSRPSNTVTSGKIFIELKARLTRALTKIKEEAGKIQRAASAPYGRVTCGLRRTARYPSTRSSSSSGSRLGCASTRETTSTQILSKEDQRQVLRRDRQG